MEAIFSITSMSLIPQTLMEIQAPKNVKDALSVLVQRFQIILGTNLVGVYLHGSLAMGTFNAVSSDIDIIAVIKVKLTDEDKVSLWAELQVLSETVSSKGFEIHVVTLGTLKHFEHPTPQEFYFHHSNRAMTSYVEPDAYDSGLAANFVITKERGVCLYGEPITNIFPSVPRQYYLQSITHDAEWNFNNIQKGPDIGTCSIPTYGVLNFCRVLAFIKGDLIASKNEGGEWGLKFLPEEYKPLVQEALKEYAQSGTAKDVDAALLKRFANYSWDIIKKPKSNPAEAPKPAILKQHK